MQLPTIFGKTFADLSAPKLLAGYLVPFLGVAWFFGLVVNNAELSEVSTLAETEAVLHAQFLSVSFFWGAGIPVLALVAVLCANTLAGEAERGTLRILLSKPLGRWKVVVATYAAIVAFGGLVGVASVLLQASLLVWMGGVDPAAVDGGVFRTLPGTVAFAFFAAAVVAGPGLALAVTTRSRLQTALGTLVVPTLFFVFFPLRLLAGDRYEEYSLYLFDVNYHFGNAFVYIHEATGTTLGLRDQVTLTIWSGVYELPGEDAGGMPASLDPVGHVGMEASFALLVALGLAGLAVALYRFQRMDV